MKGIVEEMQKPTEYRMAEELALMYEGSYDDIYVKEEFAHDYYTTLKLLACIINVDEAFSYKPYNIDGYIIPFEFEELNNVRVFHMHKLLTFKKDNGRRLTNTERALLLAFMAQDTMHVIMDGVESEDGTETYVYSGKFTFTYHEIKQAIPLIQRNKIGYYVQELEKAGFIKVHRKGINPETGKQFANEYEFLFYKKYMDELNKFDGY